MVAHPGPPGEPELLVARRRGAAYCVADEDTTPDKEVFRRFHAALYAQQPSETGDRVPRPTPS